MRKKYGLIGILLSLGIIYYVIVRYTNFSIPCLFYKIFHLKCPGCGITRMILHVSKWEWQEAMQENYYLFWMSPVIAILCIYEGFLKRGHNAKKITWSEVVGVVCVILTIAWMIIRNLLNI